jgi:hypothetical protein
MHVIKGRRVGILCYSSAMTVPATIERPTAPFASVSLA